MKDIYETFPSLPRTSHIPIIYHYHYLTTLKPHSQTAAH